MVSFSGENDMENVVVGGCVGWMDRLVKGWIVLPFSGVSAGEPGVTIYV